MINKYTMAPDKNLIFEDELNEFFSQFEDPITARNAVKERAAADHVFRTKLEQYMKKNNFTQCKDILPDWMFTAEYAYLEDRNCSGIINPESDNFETA
ncbi:MAG: hypothetical protein AB9833_02630 [Bacteroidales bacterium]